MNSDFPYKFLVYFFCLICLLQNADHACSTTLNYLKLNDLVSNATAIVSGTVIERHSYWDKKKENIWTDLRILIDRSIKGECRAGDYIFLRQRGGRIPEEDISQVALGSVLPAKGDYVLFFLVQIKKNVFRSLGLFQGIFFIEKESSSNQCVLTRKNSGANLFFHEPLKEIDRIILSGKIPYDFFMEEIMDILSSS